MIILAAAIILSLSNSGIISKANKAKADSDTANLKEYVNTLRAEWELMTAEEQAAKGSFEAYANQELTANGYKGAVGADGEVYVSLNENARAAIAAGIKIGDVVTGYTITSTTYTTDGSENNYSGTDIAQTVTTNTDITWKYLGVNADGEMEIMSVLSETDTITDTTGKQLKVTLGGKGGYLNGPAMLNTICEKLYSVSGVGTARSMNIDDVNSILGYTGAKGTYWGTDGGNTVTTAAPLTIGEIGSKLGTSLSNTATPDGRDINTYYSDYYTINKTNDVKEMKNPGNRDLVYNAKNTYWLASPCVRADLCDGFAYFYVRYVSSWYVDAEYLFDSYGDSYSDAYAVRPVVSLKSNVQLEQNTEKTAWVIK